MCPNLLSPFFASVRQQVTAEFSVSLFMRYIAKHCRVGAAPLKIWSSLFRVEQVLGSGRVPLESLDACSTVVWR